MADNGSHAEHSDLAVGPIGSTHCRNGSWWRSATYLTPGGPSWRRPREGQGWRQTTEAPEAPEATKRGSLGLPGDLSPCLVRGSNSPTTHGPPGTTVSTQEETIEGLTETERQGLIQLGSAQRGQCMIKSDQTGMTQKHLMQGSTGNNGTATPSYGPFWAIPCIMPCVPEPPVPLQSPHTFYIQDPCVRSI